MAITRANVTDGWVRQVKFEHFAGSAVFVQETANRVTVEDCKSLAPVSRNWRPAPQYLLDSMGGQTLFQRLYSINGIHEDFATGFCAPKPNAFVQCSAWQSYGYSGAN